LYNIKGAPKDNGDLRAYFDYVSVEPTPVKKELPIANWVGEQVLTEVRNSEN